MKQHSKTSWQKVGSWYDKSVGQSGHYYHQSIIIPNVLKLFDFSPQVPASLLDLACGQGVLSRHIPSHVSYTGVDAADSLIKAAKSYNPPSHHRFIKSDICKKLNLPTAEFSHAAILLALQNIEDPLALFKNVYEHLKPGASFVIVLNHPCFRIPRQSSWMIDTEKKIQYRRIDSYLSPMKIPIQTHPGMGKSSPQTLSFHFPLSVLSSLLKNAGFVIDQIQEWTSDKNSEGKNAKMENRSRDEIPLFMAIVAKKIDE